MTMMTQLMDLFNETFDRKEILASARELGAVGRLRNIHPADLCEALVSCAMGDEERSIASARRQYGRVAQYMPEESSFYDRLNAGLAALLKRLFERALAASNPTQRASVAAALDAIEDIIAIDASQVSLPKAAAEFLPSTNDAHGGFKMTASWNVTRQALQGVNITDARTHDRKALRLPRWLHGQLLLLDRGYSDHRLLTHIENRHGFFLTRLKENSIPKIVRIRRGLGKAHIGKRLTGDLPYQRTVDLDAEFSVRGKPPRRFRVVSVVVPHQQPNGREELVEIWLVTNLPPDSSSPDEVATLYRMRWDVEILFRVLKTVGRLDQLRSANIHVINCFLYATLLGLVLAQNICGLMRANGPDSEPSLHRVAALLLGYLPAILSAANRHHRHRVLAAFEAALWREGVNPNPGRPYAPSRYARRVRLASLN